VSTSQSIAATVTITGRQEVTIRATQAGQGSHISVLTGIVMITLFDVLAAMTYCAAWLHPVDLAGRLPQFSHGDIAQPRREAMAKGQRAHSGETAKTPAAGPSLLVEARGTDDVKHGYDMNTSRMLVKVGNVTWTVTDAPAYISMRDAYIKVDQLARIVLPKAHNPQPRRRR
jgi:hypothetical protein